MEEEWQPPADATVWIVCAANKYGDGRIIASARHHDKNMNAIIKAVGHSGSRAMQGFIDQFGRFYTRKQAMKMVLKNDQRFDKDRNGGNGEDLYSEGLY